VIDTGFLKALTEVPSVGTACQPIINLLQGRIGAAYASRWVSDGYILFQKRSATISDLKVLYVAHLDEIGGCVYGKYADGDGYITRCWGNHPSIYANAELQAFDYLAESADEAFPVVGCVKSIDNEERMVLTGEGIRAYRTVFTFRQETTFDGDTIAGKALDPRVTLYSALEAVLQLNSPEVGLLCVMAEECAMDVARKAVVYLQENAPNLQLIVNADVPWIRNIGEGRLDMPAIRIFEGRNFIDPMVGIHTADVLERKGVEFHLSAARSGSQTLLFTPLAPTLSIALPSDGVHLPVVNMSLRGTQRCVTLLTAAGEASLNGELLPTARVSV